ncbi:hypothetical protein OAJ86_02810 [Nitrosopumilus sp.]|nr:hypothetical protein [Nitrosopumilus sp.]
MTTSIFGEVIRVRKFTNGDIEIDFHHEEQITEYRYSADPSRLGNFTKELAETLASTLDTTICVEIFFQDDGIPSYLELEQCDDEDDDDAIYEDEEIEE